MSSPTSGSALTSPGGAGARVHEGAAPATLSGTGLPDHSRFPELDGVRALAVACVVATHAAYLTGRYVKGSATSLLAHLDVGVPIFFVLSGFLLSREWLVAAAGHRDPVRTLAYFWRRGLRILPMYWLTVAIAMLILADNRRSSGIADWVRQAFLVQIYRPGWMRDALTQTWSLCAEVAFYLVLPALGLAAVAWCRRTGWRPGTLLMACGVIVLGNSIWLIASQHAPWAVLSRNWLPSTASWFAGGIALAIVQIHLQRDHAPRWRWLAEVGSSPGMCWTAAACLYLIALTPLSGPYAFGAQTGGQAVVKNLLYLGIALMLVWPCVLGRSTAVRLVFGNRPMRFVGEISYSIFLLHLLVLEGVVKLLGYRPFTGSTVTAFVMAMGLSILAAALAYRLVERPVMRLRRLVPATAPRRRAASSAAAAEAQS
jgi:peptidoglycan/LPS O-acetylase OafA/YrhL